MLGKNLRYVIEALAFVAVIAFAISAFGEMSSIRNATQVTYAIQDYSTSQKVVFNGAVGHKPHFRDYFGLFAAGSETRLAWCYLDGSKVQDTARALTTGSCVFDNLKPGDYAVRVYAAGGLTLIDATLFTVGPPAQEYRAVPADGVVTIERTKINATTDKATIKRSGHPNVETLTVPTGSVFKQVPVSYTGQPATLVPIANAAPKSSLVRSQP